MRAALIDRHTLKLRAPSDWDADKNGHCGTLYVRQEELNGIAFMRSAWEFDSNEASLLLAGAKMVVGVAGEGHPVLHFEVAELPNDFQPVVTAVRVVGTDGSPGVKVEMVFDHNGGQRGVCQVSLAVRTHAEGVAHGIEQIEALARKQGWIA